METKEICQKLNQFIDDINVGGKHRVNLSLFSDAADRLEELENENEFLKNARVNLMKECVNLRKQLSQQQLEWISVEDGKEMPDAISYTGIRHDQFPRLVIVTDVNREVTHWMMLDAPKPKEPTFKDVFLKAFPKALLSKDGVPGVCIADIFPWGIPTNCEGIRCNRCWNQPYFEEEGGE